MRSNQGNGIVGRIVGTIIKILIFVPIVIFVLGEVVLHLWNWLIPTLFHLPAISFWQALGLLVLSWTLFGGFRGAGRGHHGFGRRRWRQRWEHMTPEEREKFREWARARCSSFAAAVADAQPKP